MPPDDPRGFYAVSTVNFFWFEIFWNWGKYLGRKIFFFFSDPRKTIFCQLSTNDDDNDDDDCENDDEDNEDKYDEYGKVH
jgi:hypothetical protein